jgi:hypothetical protein
MSTHSLPVVFQTPRDNTSVADQGYPVLAQTGTITQNGTSAVDLKFYLPKYSQIIGFWINIDTAFDSGTSATLSIGTASAGTQYLTSANVKAAAGLLPLTATHVTGTQSAAWADISTNTTMVATVTPVGSTTAGVVRVTVLYKVTRV